MNKLYRSLVAGLAVIGLVGCGDDITLEPPVPPQPTPITVTVAPDGVTIPVGGTVQMVAAVSGATGAAITWSTSSATVASVNATGLVTGVAVGSAGITATATAGGVTGAGSATITVSSVQTTPATISIGAITNVAGTPVVLAAAAGQLNVALNLERGGESIQRVELLLDNQVVGSQNFTLLATKAAGEEFDVIEVLTISFNTASFNATTGIADFLNGAHTLSARVITAQNQQGTVSPSIAITLANTSIVFVTAEVVGTKTTANGPAGLLWESGDLQATALPVVFTAGTAGAPTVTQVVLTPSAGGLAAKTLTAAPFVATWAKGTSIATGGAGSGNLGVEVGGLTVGATSTVGGVAGPVGTSAALNFDTQAPTVPAVFVNPNGRLNGWVNDAVLFTALQTANVNGMITAASTDAGVSAAGGAAITYAAKAAPGAIAGALAAADITDPTSLAPSNANAICLVAFAIDGLGNRNSNPAGACAATTQSTTIGVDRFAPIINYDATSMANMSRRNGATIAGEFVVTVLDTGTVGNSGMLAGSPVKANVKRHDAANAAACVVGAGATCAQTATGLAVTLPTVSTTITALTVAGFYTFDATAFDAAGNSTPLAAMRTIVWDATAPALTTAQVSLATNFYNGGIPQQFVSLANDNLDIWTLQYQIAYGAVIADINFGTQTLNPFNATPLLNSNVSVPLNVPFFIRQVQVASVGAGMTVGAVQKPTAILGTLTDQATNVDAGSPVTTPIPATSVVTGSATAFPGAGAQQMDSWGVTSASQTVGNGTGATVPLSRTLTAVAAGPTATFNPPFARVDFYIINGGTLNLLPCTATLVTTDDGSVQGRKHTYSCIFTPGTTFVTGQIQAIGVTTNGDALATANGAGPTITIQP